MSPNDFAGPGGRAAVRTMAELVDHLDDELGDTTIHFPDSGQKLTHRDIPERARGVTRTLLDAGIGAGDVVGLLVGSVPGFPPAAFGVWGAGAAIMVLPIPPVPMPPEAVAESLHRLLDRLACVVVDEQLQPVADELARRRPGLKIVRIADCPVAAERPPGAGPTPDSPAIMQFTSGSTARPKCVVLPHRAVLACLSASTIAGETTPGDVHISWVPLFHDFGLITLLHGIWSGFEHHLFTAWSFIRKPRKFVEYVGTHRATIIGGPNFAFDRMAEACADGLPDGLDLSALRLILNGAEPVKPATIARFAEVFGPAGLSPAAMTPVYGMAEATMSVASPPPGVPPRVRWFDRTALVERGMAEEVTEAAEGSLGLVSVGGPVAELELEVRTEDGARAADGEVGEIVLRGPAVATGYLDEEEMTATTFRDGWLHTGDLGVLADGELYVAGRRKDMIIVAGKNFFAEDVEDVVRSAMPGGTGQCVAFADQDTERIVVVAEVDDPEQATSLVDRLRAQVSAVLHLGQVDVYVVGHNMLPRTTSGKWQRRLTARYLKQLTTGA